MARKKQGKPAPVVESLEEIESLAERMAQWIGENARLVMILVVVLLVVAGGVQTYRSQSREAVREASNALAQVRDAYLVAMGANPGSFEIPELANPEAQSGVRQEFSKRFIEVAESNAGTVQGALAWLEAGILLGEIGENAAAVEAWRKGLEAAPAAAPVRGMLLVRIAGEEEDRGRWIEAAETHAQAADLEQYPLRFWAMTDAARCFDRAGNSERALALLERVDADAPSLQLPGYLRERLNELRAGQASNVRAS